MGSVFYKKKKINLALIASLLRIIAPYSSFVVQRRASAAPLPYKCSGGGPPGIFIWGCSSFGRHQNIGDSSPAPFRGRRRNMRTWEKYARTTTLKYAGKFYVKKT